MSKISRKAKEKQLKSFGDHHQKFLSRITKTLYYGKLPNSDRLSLPVTELATELFSEAKSGKSLERLHCDDAAAISRNACVSPCSFILALLYLERLKTCNPDYLHRMNPSELFLVSLMVSSKFLFDDGEEDEVFVDEWAHSGGLSVVELVQLEKEFLNAINWEVFVNEVTFWKKLNDIERTIAKKEGVNRGWFTYTELNSILTSTDAYHFYQYIASLVVVLLATYTAGIITIISSMLIVSHVPGSFLQPSVRPIDTNDTATCSYAVDSNERLRDMETNVNDTAEAFDELKYNLFQEVPAARKQVDVLDVLKAGLILASIKPVVNRVSNSNKSYFTDDLIQDENSEKVSWDWWSSPSMNWLTSTSELAQNLDLMPNFKDYVYISYPDSTVVTSKVVEQEDHVHKATRTRIQDQLERSWHKEWTDTIRSSLFGPDERFKMLPNLKT